MDWFDACYKIDKPSIRIAHFTDCHLFEQKNGEYFNVNTYQNLKKTLLDMKGKQLDLAIFGGDLTQDHTLQSYQNFVDLVIYAQLDCPVFWLPGNHDELTQFEQAFIEQNKILNHKRIDTAHFQVLLLNSKSETPSGLISDSELIQIKKQISESQKPSIIFSHHHPISVEGYIDKHILNNGDYLMSELAQTQKVSLLIHGHVHNDYHKKYKNIEIYATPATSIQFKKRTSDWQQEDLGAGYRLIEISEVGEINTQAVWLKSFD